MNYRSYTKTQVLEAFKKNFEVWKLINAGDKNDVLIGTFEDVCSGLISQYRLPKLPKRWILIPILFVDDLE